MENVLINENVNREYFGEVEIEYRDPKTKKIIHTQKDRNVIKIFAKEMLSHSVIYNKRWDPDLNDGEWVDANPFDDFKIKYMLIGASFDEHGVPLDINDPRYYIKDEITGFFVPIKLTPGAEYNGGLINAIPINEEAHRPLKRIENAYFKPTYQPAGTPLLQSDVRAINNILVIETVLREEEYNGFGLVESDHFTITEVALCGGPTIGSVVGCDIDPHQLFTEGPWDATAYGGDVITMDAGDANHVIIGDQIKMILGTGQGSQVSEYYLVMDKYSTAGGVVDITLDRTPVADGEPIVGDITLYKDNLRIFAHRILSTPAKKSSSFEIVIRWSIFFT